ncbi:unnamed protein product [Caretta caretta]
MDENNCHEDGHTMVVNLPPKIVSWCPENSRNQNASDSMIPDVIVPESEMFLKSLVRVGDSAAREAS